MISAERPQNHRPVNIAATELSVFKGELGIVGDILLSMLKFHCTSDLQDKNGGTQEVNFLKRFRVNGRNDGNFQLCLHFV